MGRRTVLLLALLALASALAACSRSPDPGPAATVATAAPTSATTTSAGVAPTTATTDPFAVPAVIDAAYVNRVLAELYRIEGDVVRAVLGSRALDIQQTAGLRAVYNDPQYQTELESLPELATADTSRFKAPPGNRQARVSLLVAAGPRCVVAATHSDFSDVVRVPPTQPPDEVDLITLRPTQEGADPARLNPTGWSIHDERVVPNTNLPSAETSCAR